MSNLCPKDIDRIDDSGLQNAADSSNKSYDGTLQRETDMSGEPALTMGQKIDINHQRYLRNKTRHEQSRTALRIALELEATEAGNDVLRQENAELEQRAAESKKLTKAMEAQLEGTHQVAKAEEELSKAGQNLVTARQEDLKLLNQKYTILQAEVDARAGGGCTIL